MKAIRRVVLVLCVLALTAPALPLRGAAEGPAEDGVRMVALNFGDSVDVRVLAKWISEVTQQTFAYDESFQGTVMLETPTKLPESALMPLFESILQLKGYALVRREDVLMIVENRAAAALEPGIDLQEGELEEEGEFVNKIVTLRYADGPTVAAAVKPFMSGEGSVHVLSEHNKLALSDYTDKVQRALRIISQLDRMEAHPQVVLKRLEYALASDVVPQLSAAFQKRAKGPRAGLPLFNADRRTNSVVIVAAKEDLKAIEAVLRRLDVEAVEPERPIRVYALHNTKAEHILPILTDVIQDLRAGEGGGEGGASAEGEGGGETGGVFGGPSPQGGKSGAEHKPIKIVGDEENNLLVVVATRAEHQWLEKLIADLDKRRPQVLIEGWLVSLTERGARQLGVELAARAGGGGSEGTAGTFFSQTTVDEDTGELVVPSPPGEGLTLAVLRAGEVRAILNALLTEQNAKVLSRPRLLANANQEATFQSVNQEPFVTVSAITTTTSTTAFGGFEQAGTELTITPTILEGDFVYLEVRMVVSNFTGAAPAAQVPPPRDENKVETTVTVPNRSTIIIGGIVRSEERETVKKVPILGDIPLLGWLFRSTSSDVEDTVLYAFISPQIFRAEDFADIREVSARAEQNLRDATRKHGTRDESQADEE